jgi:transposase
MHAEHIRSRPEPRQGSRRFRLSQFFSLTSLIGIVAVTACVLWTNSAFAERRLAEHRSWANADLARAFAHAAWGRQRSTCD